MAVLLTKPLRYSRPVPNGKKFLIGRNPRPWRPFSNWIYLQRLPGKGRDKFSKRG